MTLRARQSNKFTRALQAFFFSKIHATVRSWYHSIFIGQNGRKIHPDCLLKLGSFFELLGAYAMKQWVWLMGLLFGSAAFAEGQAPATDSMGSGAMAQGVMLAAFALIFYFLFIRPQSKRAKEHQKLVNGLQKGDEVITSAGILGKITRITDNFLIVMIAEGVEIPIQRHAIASSVPKGTLKSIE